MLFTTHALVGTVVGQAIGNPVAGFLVAFALHFLLDWVPHVDPGSFFFGRKHEQPENLSMAQKFMAVLDVLAGTGFIVLIYLQITPTAGYLWGALGGVAPDVLDNTPYIKQVFRQIPGAGAMHRFHEKFHHTLPWRKAWFGLGFQLVLVFISMYLLLKWF